MEKIITDQQIDALIETIYQTNISAKVFDAIKKMLLTLPQHKVEAEKSPIPPEKVLPTQPK